MFQNLKFFDQKQKQKQTKKKRPEWDWLKDQNETDFFVVHFLVTLSKSYQIL